MVAKMRNLGSACTAANRFYVHEAVHDAFAAKLAARMGAMRVGNPLDEGVEVGSLVNQDTFAKVGAFVDDAVAKGARVLTGGRPPGGPGWFYPPSVLVVVPDTASCLRHEFFGSVDALPRFSDEEDMIRRCNHPEYQSECRRVG